MNTGEPSWPDILTAGQRVQRMQAKLHRWAGGEASRRFDDLFNLVCDPAFLMVAWERVRSNKGGRTPGVDRVVPAFISDPADVVAFLAETRQQLRTGTFAPLPVREKMIPKPGKRGAVPPPGHSHGGGIVPRRPVTLRGLLLSPTRFTR